MAVIKPWIAQKIVDLLGGEDEVVVNYVFGLLEEPVCLSNFNNFN